MALAAVISIIDKLQGPLLQELQLVTSVSDKVESVRQTLAWIKPFLEDAETRSNESKVIKHWVAEVRDVAYRIEDAIDIYVVEIQGDRTAAGSGLIARIKRVYKRITRKPVALHKLGVELEKIEAVLQKIDQNRKLFDVNVLGESSCARAEAELRRPTTLKYIDDDSRILELEVDETVLAKVLQPHSPGLSVLSIVGAGGLGKTTLAQKTFNSAKVKEKFDIRIWVCVSKENNRANVLKKMLEDIRKLKPEEIDRDEGYFIKEIRESLTNKRFLIVLDDVWSETFWPDHIRVACPPVNEFNEGQVLITTRDRNVAENAYGEIFELQFLNADESKMLFYKIVFPKQTPPDSFDLLATELVTKCGGLPLAIVVLGGRLRVKKSYAEWRKVADSIDWQGSKCRSILAASYDDMPVFMKMCFMYLASFPEDYEIDAKSLVRTWVAEDIVSDEITGENCLEELVQRCLVIASRRSYDDSLELCRLHDILRELAIYEAKENKFLSVLVRESWNQSFNNERRVSLQSWPFARRISSNFEETEVKRKYDNKLRSLLIFGESPIDLSVFRLLKVLKVHHCVISSIKMENLCEKLIHLRHLEFRECDGQLSEIPESIGHLKNLLTLDCTGTDIGKLPKSLRGISTLRSLRCLKLHGIWHKNVKLQAKLFPPQLTELSLSGFYFKNDPMPELEQLQYLEILELINGDVILELIDSDEILELINGDDNGDGDDDDDDDDSKDGDGEQIMTMTCSAGGFSQLRKLILKNFRAEEFRIAPRAMPMLKHLHISNFVRMKSIPELQHLKVLQYFGLIYAPYSANKVQAVIEENRDKLQHIPSVITGSLAEEVIDKIRRRLYVAHAAYASN